MPPLMCDPPNAHANDEDTRKHHKKMDDHWIEYLGEQIDKQLHLRSCATGAGGDSAAEHKHNTISFRLKKILGLELNATHSG